MGAPDGFIDASGMLSAGVYLLVKRGTVIYVGKAKGLYSRIYTHRTMANRKAKGGSIPSWLPAKGFVFDEVFIRPCHVDKLDALEREMINLFKPKFNLSLVQGPKVTAPIALKLGSTIITMNAPEEKIARRI